MKITGFETFHIKPRWLFLKISTDQGLCGWGEPVLEGQSKVVEAAVHSFGRQLIGQDPRRIEHLWQLMYRGPFYRGGPIMISAISGIEQALWDIKGKDSGLPVYEMLGGSVRNRIKMYPHLKGDYPDGGDESAEKWVESALKRKSQGFSMMKFALDGPMNFLESNKKISHFIDKVSQVRTALGDDTDFAIDFHGRVSAATAIRICHELEPLRPLFVEEPVPPGNADALLRVRQATTIPIAAGERLVTRWGFKDILEKGAVDIIQPDLCHAGGILEVKKIAAMGEVYQCALAPHNPLGPISLASCLQVAACTPNFLVQEMPAMDNRWDQGEGLLNNPFKVKDGYIDLPQRPGLGIEINEESLKERIYSGEWTTPLFLHEDDQSIADW